LGYTISMTSDEDEVLRWLRGHPVRAVLVDIAAPEVNGIAICAAVRRAGHRQTIIVGLNQGEIALRQEALGAGADLVLDEPINWADLRHWLEAPRGADGHLLAEGALLGTTREDTIGAASLLAHDLKSPVSVIISSLEVLLSFEEDDGMTEPTRRLLRGALNAAYRQLNLVSAVVDLPRLELDCYELQLTPLDLVEVIRESLEKEAYNLDTKGLAVTLDLPDMPLPVRVDRDLIQRVIATLVDNVMKFTVRGDTLRIHARCEGKSVMLSFTDSGRPIQPGFEHDIMTRAPQWERRQSGARTSVALGLPFVYAVARAHQGDFTAGSTPDGKLTTFTFKLPAHQS
jgi:two-component system phosphate regulon sensor histidine kinase PhoR